MAIAHIKKYAKLLTLPMVFYSFFLFSSSHANVSKEDLGKLSASQLKKKYEIELYSAVEDRKIYSPEVEKLDNILGHYLKAKEKGYSKITVESVKDNNQNNIAKDSLDSIVKDFEENILFNYPDLIVKDGSVKYDGFEIISISEGEIFKKLINRTYSNFVHKILIEYDYLCDSFKGLQAGKISQLLSNRYEMIKKEKRLASLLNKKSYEIRDLKIFFNILKDFEKIAQNSDPIETNTPAKEASPLGLIKLSLPNEQLKSIKLSYEKYLNARDKQFAEAKKYWSPGYTIAFSDGNVGVSNDLNYTIRSQLKASFTHQGYPNISIYRNVFKNVGFKGKFPVPWWVLSTLGLGFPFVRNGLLAKYTKRDFDFNDGFEGGLQAFGILLDFLHPWVFPIRMLGTPFVLEPLRRISKIYNY